MMRAQNVNPQEIILETYVFPISVLILTLKKRIMKKKDKGLGTTRPLMDHFSWHRIILDEGHEILGQHFYSSTLIGFLC